MKLYSNNLPTLASGCYVVAVSGGVDSMVLLDILRQQPGLELVVAHVDHGVRSDSYKDAALVQQFSQSHGLIYESVQLNLGAQASEDAARTQRYVFLQQCQRKHGAVAIITAHHQDDMLETALIAIMRGTGWRGLAPFVGNTTTVRPLLAFTKNSIVAYARRNSVPWREDSTNSDERYLRNYIRRTLVPMLDQKSDTWRDDFLQRIIRQRIVRDELEAQLAEQLPHVNGQRYPFIMLPQPVAYELLQTLVRQQTGNTLLRPQAEAALLFLKVAKPGKIMQLGVHWQLRVQSAKFVVEPRSS